MIIILNSVGAVICRELRGDDNFISNLVEVMELLAGNVQEFAPLVLVGLLVRCFNLLANTVCLGFRGSRAIDKL